MVQKVPTVGHSKCSDRDIDNENTSPAIALLYRKWTVQYSRLSEALSSRGGDLLTPSLRFGLARQVQTARLPLKTNTICHSIF